MNSHPANRWFVCPQPDPGAKTRLFLFPYAGGGPASFNKWPAALPDTVEPWIAHYPGRGSRYNETPFKRIDSLAQNLSQAIQPLLDKPFVFFGHSLGALVAFELTGQLAQQNLSQPQILFVSACAAPSYPNPLPPIHDLPEPQFLQALQELNGIPDEVMNVPELMELLLPALRADFEAAETYRITTGEFRLHCPIVALGGHNDPRVNSQRLEAWLSYTTGAFKSYYFPGDHFFINTARDAIIGRITEGWISFQAKADAGTTWSKPPDILGLRSGQVDVWRIALDLPPATVKSFESVLSADERERATRFRVPNGKKRYIVAHGCLRHILARYLDCAPAQLQFSTNEYGKPALQDYNLEFNLSHSGDFALVAVTQEQKVGVDVERTRPELEFIRMANRFFSPREVQELMALPPEQHQRAFFNCWSRKEAFIKAQGLGLSLPLDSFDVSLDEPAILRTTRPDPAEAARWTLRSIDVKTGYAAAVAVEGKGLEFRFWDYCKDVL